MNEIENKKIKFKNLNFISKVGIVGGWVLIIYFMIVCICGVYIGMTAGY